MPPSGDGVICAAMVAVMIVVAIAIIGIVGGEALARRDHWSPGHGDDPHEPVARRLRFRHRRPQPRHRIPQLLHLKPPRARDGFLDLLVVLDTVSSVPRLAGGQRRVPCTPRLWTAVRDAAGFPPGQSPKARPDDAAVERFIEEYADHKQACLTRATLLLMDCDCGFVAALAALRRAA